MISKTLHFPKKGTLSFNEAPMVTDFFIYGGKVGRLLSTLSCLSWWGKG